MADETTSEPRLDGPTAARSARARCVSTRMDKTVVVAVVERVRHPRYDKTVQRTKRLYAHDETNDVNVGDRVRVQETRPLSKLKRWRLVEVLERAQVIQQETRLRVADNSRRQGGALHQGAGRLQAPLRRRSATSSSPPSRTPSPARP